MKEYSVTGMSCAACVARVEQAVKKVDGVQAVSVSLLTNSMTVEGDFDDQNLRRTVTKAGYGIGDKNTSLQEKKPKEGKSTLRL